MSMSVAKPNSPNLAVIDTLIIRLLAVLGGITLIALLLVPHFFIPAEDAVILFQFSRNLAHTGAISFVTHGSHAEGATDFAWMVFLAIATKFGLNTFWVVAVCNVLSLLGVSFLVLAIAGRKLARLSFFSIIGIFALLPQIFAAASGFSTLPFACLLLLLAISFLNGNDILIALTSLVLCLFRPDGVVFAIPIMMAALLLRNGRKRRALLDLSCFLLPGTLYFLWRWHYFDEFLPLPFLVKSDVQRIAHLFVLNSVMEAKPYCLIILVLSLLAFQDNLLDRVDWALIICFIILPTAFYFAMRLDQNIGDRFYIYLPVGVSILLAKNWERVPRITLIRVSAVLWLYFLARPMLWSGKDFLYYQFDNRRAIAQDLSSLPGGTMIVTEAGILPYYSGWTAYDAWGLNTAAFAKRLFQPVDVAKIHPDIILAYPGDNKECFALTSWKTPYTNRTWEHLTRNIVAGAQEQDFELWLAPFGSSRYRLSHGQRYGDGKQECWYINPNSPLHKALEEVLAKHGGMTGSMFRLTHPSM